MCCAVGEAGRVLEAARWHTGTAKGAKKATAAAAAAGQYGFLLGSKPQPSNVRVDGGRVKPLLRPIHALCARGCRYSQKNFGDTTRFSYTLCLCFLVMQFKLNTINISVDYMCQHNFN